MGSRWVDVFQLLVAYGGVNFTRLDLALDDYDGVVDFDKIKQKLADGHYRSFRKTYNIVKTSNSKQSPLGETIYIGNARADNGSQGNVYARFYDKRAQYLAKNQLFPTDVKSIGREQARKSGNVTR